MRRYETIVIIDPDLSPEARDPIFERIKDLISEMAGFFVALEEWGAKKLAYEIRKKHRGYYVRFDFCGSGALVNEFERVCQIDDRVLKYMTVLLDKTPNIEHIKEALAEAAEAAKAAEVAEAAKAAEAARAASEEQAPTPEVAADSEPEIASDKPATDPAANTEEE